jgi:hypothetical protein
MLPSTGTNIGINRMKALSVLPSIILVLAFSGSIAAQGANDCVTGAVSLSDAVAGKISSGGTLFVYIRETGRRKGPPTAVVTIRNPVYPQSFVLCGSNQMLAGAAAKPISDRYRAYARHSLTGAPMAQEGFLGTTTGTDNAGIRAGDKIAISISRPLVK